MNVRTIEEGMSLQSRLVATAARVLTLRRRQYYGKRSWPVKQRDKVEIHRLEKGTETRLHDKVH